MSTVCIWVIAFKIITAYLHAWTNAWMPPIVRTLIFGTLELVNGCCSLPELQDMRVRFIACSGMLAFGGLCVLMQTSSIVRDLGTGNYLFGKILQTVFSITISSALVLGKWYLMGAASAPIVYFLMRKKIRVEISPRSVYDKARTVRRSSLCCFVKKWNAPALTVCTERNSKMISSFAVRKGCGASVKTAEDSNTIL